MLAYAALTLVGNVAACAVAIVLARYFRRYGIGIWLAIVGGVATIEVWAGVTLLLLPRNGSVDTADVSFPYAKAMCMAGPCVPEVMIVPALIGLVGTLFGLIVAIRVDHRFTQARTGADAGVAAGVTIASVASLTEDSLGWANQSDWGHENRDRRYSQGPGQAGTVCW